VEWEFFFARENHRARDRAHAGVLVSGTTSNEIGRTEFNNGFTSVAATGIAHHHDFSGGGGTDSQAAIPTRPSARHRQPGRRLPGRQLHDQDMRRGR